MKSKTSFIVPFTGIARRQQGCDRAVTDGASCKVGITRWCCSASKTQLVQTDDGGTISVQIYNIKSATSKKSKTRAVLLLHDFMTDKRLFRRLTAESALQGCLFIAPDLRGFGASSAPREPYSRSKDLLSVIRTILKEDGLQRVDVVGCGLGGAVALELALEAADSVRSVAVIGSGLPGHSWSTDRLFVDISASRLAGRLLQVVDKRVVEAAVKDATDIVKWKRSFIATNSTWGDVLKTGQKQITKELLEMARDYRGFHFFHEDPLVPCPFDGNPLIDRIVNVSQPVLVLVGETDTMDFREIALEIWDRVPNRYGDVVHVEATGHFVILERPNVVARKLKEFWDDAGE